MNIEFYFKIGNYLESVIRKSIKAGKSSIATLTKKTLRFSESGDVIKDLMSVDWNENDYIAIQNFKVEVFTVASVGCYELEQKLKRLAIEIQEGKHKLQQKNPNIDPLKLFSSEASSLITDYVPTSKHPPGSWLETNLQTAISSSYNASRWIRLNDENMNQLYPYLRYETVRDNKVRKEHQLLDNRVWSVKDPVWEKIYPPNGWNCRCFVTPLENDDNINVETTDGDEEEIKNIIKQGGVSKEFQRNSGSSKSIYGKWLDSEFRDIDKTELKKNFDEYKKETGVKENFKFDFKKINEIKKSSSESLNIKNYDDDKIISDLDDESRKILNPVFKNPDEVWGELKSIKDERNSVVNYIKYSGDKAIIVEVINSKVGEIKVVDKSSSDKYKKGVLLK